MDDLLALSFASPHVIRAFLAAKPAWHRDGACQEHGPGLFFPAPGHNIPAKAREICAHCLVRAECLEYALGCPPDLEGVWGGASKRERQKMRREQARAAKADPIAS